MIKIVWLLTCSQKTSAASLPPVAPPTPKKKDRTLSGLNNAISTINIVKDLVPLELAKGVLSAVSGLLGIVKVCPLVIGWIQNVD